MANIDDAINEIQGRQSQSPNIDQAIDSIMGSQQQTQSAAGQTGSFGQTIPQVSPEQESPLSFTDRLGLAFADDSSKETILKDKFNVVQRLENGKFAVGNDIRNVMPIDPEGILNDIPGDLADAANLIAPIAGQIIGGGVGATAGPGGVIAGGAVGAGIGEAINKAIGKGFGINQQKASEAATDIAISTAFGAFGEGLGQVIKGAAPVVAKQGSKAIQEIIKRNPLKKEAIENTTARVLNFSSNVNPEATKAVFKYSPEKVFTKSNNNFNSILRISKNVADDITEHRASLGKSLGASLNKIRNADKDVISMGDDVGKFLNDLVDNEFITPDFKVNRNLITDGSDATIFKKILNQLNVKTSKTGASISFKNDFSPRKVISLKKQLSDKFGSLSNNGQRLVSGFRKTLSKHLDEFADRAGVTEFKAANQKFAQFAQAMDDLKDSGFNLEKGTNVADFIKNYFNRNPITKQALRTVDKQTTLPILENIEKFAAAQAFKSAKPDILRFGFIAGLAGFARAETPEEKALSIGGALLLGSPAGNKLILQSILKGKKFAKGAPIGFKQKSKVDPRILQAILSQSAAKTTPQDQSR